MFILIEVIVIHRTYYVEIITHFKSHNLCCIIQFDLTKREIILIIKKCLNRLMLIIINLTF